MIPVELVKKATDSGVVFTCAMCLNFWRAKASNLNECRPLLSSECSGPLRGKGYPHYDGVLKGHLHTACFVCGCKPDGVLKTHDGVMVGICNKHRDALFDFSGPVDGRPETADSLKVEEKTDA